MSETFLDTRKVLFEPTVFGYKRNGAYDLGPVTIVGNVNMQARLVELSKPGKDDLLWIAINHAASANVSGHGIKLHEEGLQNLARFLENPDQYPEKCDRSGFPVPAQMIPGAIGAVGFLEQNNGIAHPAILACEATRSPGIRQVVLAYKAFGMNDARAVFSFGALPRIQQIIASHR